MLRITVPGIELFDEATSTFSTTGDLELSMEHSLLSLSKWESKHQKPFLAQGDKTSEEILDYIKAMLLDEKIDEEVLTRLSSQNLDQINEYINSKESATTFRQTNERGRGETITAELIYYWMVSYNIPFSCETWHINRLFVLIRICGIKNSKQKKMSKREIAQQNQELNAARRAKLGTSG